MQPTKGLSQIMKAHGWRCVGRTGTGNPNRFRKQVSGMPDFYVRTAPAKRWRLEYYTGFDFYFHGYKIKKTASVISPRFETAMGMALYFEYVLIPLWRAQNA